MLSARHAILTGQAVHLPFYILGLHGLDTEKRSMILPLCIVFYALLQGFTRLMDAFPEMMHHNNSDLDD